MRNFWDILRELHIANCKRSVDQYQADIDRASAGLQKSLDALAAAKAAKVIHDHVGRPSKSPPLYLIKGKQ